MKMIVLFEKKPRLRHIGHLDLMRTMQRALRRSDLPLRYSQGFNPHILLTFAAPLSVGMPGQREIMEVPLASDVTEAEFMRRLGAALPPDLPLLSARAVDDRHPAPMALLTAAAYEARLASVPEGLQEAIEGFLAQKEIPVMKKTKSGLKPADIRPMIYDLRLAGDTLHFTLALSEKATCKPELLLETLFAHSALERPDMRITRVQLYGEENGRRLPLENL